MRREPSITFDAKRESFPKALDYYLAVYRGSEAGFSAQQISALVTEIVSVGSLSDQSFEAKGFRPEGVGAGRTEAWAILKACHEFKCLPSQFFAG